MAASNRTNIESLTPDTAAKLDEFIQSYGEELKEDMKKMENDIKQLKEDKKKMENEIKQLKEDKKNMENEIKQLKDDNEKDKKKMENDIKKLKDDMKELKDSLNAKKRKCDGCGSNQDHNDDALLSPKCRRKEAAKYRDEIVNTFTKYCPTPPSTP